MLVLANGQFGDFSLALLFLPCAGLAAQVSLWNSCSDVVCWVWLLPSVQVTWKGVSLTSGSS